MSIIVDALNRLQAERMRLWQGHSSSGSSGPQPQDSATTLPQRVQLAGMTLRTLGILGFLGGLAFGAYWWGQSLIPEVPYVEEKVGLLDEVSPKSDDRLAPPSSPQEEGEEGIPPIADSVDPSGTQANDASTPSPDIQGSEAYQESPSPGLAPVREMFSPQAGDQQSLLTPIPQERNSASASPRSASHVGQKSISSEGAMDATLSRRPSPSSLTADDHALVHAQALIKQHRYKQAVAVLSGLFETSPNEWEPWFWMGTAQLGLGNLDEAETAFVEGLARDASRPELWVQRAIVAQQRGRYVEAIEALRQAQLLAPDLPEVHLNLAYSFEQQGLVQLAVRHYRHFLRLTEQKPAYHEARKKVVSRMLRLDPT
ncbi:MAG: tetratricopeptide repeat protein [Nitrospirae bacterium]|nr:MAG: tetratricopeptide repeat protein [Nitrospirota bacterium]